MHLTEKLLSAAVRPDGWDVPGLLQDAASLIFAHEAFIRSLINTEERGRAVPPHVRDDAREVLGIWRCES